MSLANRSAGLSDEALLNCFLSGLNAHIRRDVVAMAPTSLLRVVALAKLYEDKYNSGTKHTTTNPHTFHYKIYYILTILFNKLQLN
jgi:hypothetical protein